MEKIEIKTNYATIRNDVFETGLIELMDKPAFIALMKKDTTISPNKEFLKINKPEKVPASLDEAIESTVTVKCDRGHGSGFIISNDGYIITNYHVIADKNQKYKVLTHSGKELPATVIRYNNRIDLALLKVDTTFDKAFAIPQEKNFATAQDIFAIGTPQSLELAQTISKGVISAFRNDDDLPIIQTDTRINSGNSGGPTVNSKGEVVGIAVSKIKKLGVEGLSFAIPAYMINRALTIGY